MGEYAEMMLDGTLCASCGGYIEQREPDGIPRYCSAQCRRDSGIAAPRSKRRLRNVPCPVCAKPFSSEYALSQHQRDTHERADHPNQPAAAEEQR